MAQQLVYKTYARDTRVQQVDTNHTGGMLYSNVPLAEQNCKALVNFDITKEGTLKVRQGLRVKTNSNVTPVLSNFKLLDCTPAAAFKGSTDNVHCIAVDSSNSTATGKNTIHATPSFAFMHYSSNNNVGTGTDMYLTKYTGNAHALECTHKIEQYIGCRAFNNDYYYLGQQIKGDTTVASLFAQRYTDGSTTCSLAEITPKECTIQEAVNRGYNMLHNTPYAFASKFDTSLAAHTLQGIQPYANEACTQLEVNPKRGQSIYFKLIGNFQTYKQTIDYVILGSSIGHDSITISIKWEVSTNGGYSFNTIGITTAEATKNPGNTNTLSIPVYKFKEMLSIKYNVRDAANTLVRATLNYRDTKDVEVALTALDSFNFTVKNSTEAEYYEPKNYSLNYCSGMCFWKERLILWGAPEDKTILFVSDTRDPSYFPYPNNVNTFDEPIIQAVPLLDNLVVFTSTKVYLLSLDADYEHLTQKCIQNNLQIEARDTHLTQVVKNMLYFKSGNYYYMIVPKANSLTGELTIAPVYKNIEFFLDNFKEELYKILKMVYNYNEAELEQLQLATYYNYLDYEDVVNVYAFETINNTYLNFSLLYNTIQRTWRIYIYETPALLTPVTKSATSKNTYAMLYNNCYYDLIFDKEDAHDAFGTLFKNYQLYDSGYRDHTVNLKKRYREVQFVLHNISNKKLRFGTGVFIDGGTRSPLYNVNFVTKALNENNYLYTTEYTGTQQHVELVVENNFANVVEVPSATVLGTWELNASLFPEQTVYKTRFPISGKGYAPRLLIINKDEAMIELLNISYIYRMMYSR